MVSNTPVTRALPLILAIAASSGCITRPGMNTNCGWPPEAATSLDVRERGAARHLVQDVELAVELADRYSTRQRGSPQLCEAKLLAAIALTHSVTIEDVVAARSRVADRGLNLPVNLTMAGLFVLAAVWVVGWVRRRFPEERIPAVVTLILASVVLTGIFVVLGDLWSSVLLMIRVGSHHVGGRAAQLPWRQHTAELFAAGVVLFWVVTLARGARAGSWRSSIRE